MWTPELEQLRAEVDWLHGHGLAVRVTATLTPLDVTDVPPTCVDPSLTGWPACVGHRVVARAEVFDVSAGTVRWGFECGEVAVALVRAMSAAHAELDWQKGT